MSVLKPHQPFCIGTNINLKQFVSNSDTVYGIISGKIYQIWTLINSLYSTEARNVKKKQQATILSWRYLIAKKHIDG